MILGDSLIEDESNRAEIVKEFILVAGLHSGLDTNKSDLSTSIESSVNKKSVPCNKSKRAKGKTKLRSTSTNTKNTLSTVRCSPAPSQESTFPLHLMTIISFLQTHNVDLSRTDDSILEYIVDMCMDDNNADVDLAEVVCSYFPELPKNPPSDLANALRHLARECFKIRVATATDELNGDVHGDNEEVSTNEGCVDNRVVAKNCGGEDGVESGGEEEVVHQDIVELRDVFPHIPVDIIQYVCLIKFAGNRVEAGQFLIDNCTGECHLTA